MIELRKMQSPLILTSKKKIQEQLSKTHKCSRPAKTAASLELPQGGAVAAPFVRSQRARTTTDSRKWIPRGQAGHTNCCFKTSEKWAAGSAFQSFLSSPHSRHLKMIQTTSVSCGNLWRGWDGGDGWCVSRCQRSQIPGQNRREGG